MIRFPELERLGVAVAAFSERNDGDCALHNAVDLAGSLAARRRLLHSCGTATTHLVCAKQAHCTVIAAASHDDAGRGAELWETGFDNTDGLLTRDPGLMLGVLVADCVPLYLIDPTRRTVALIHAGRKGTRANIAGKAVAALTSDTVATPSAMYALLGPSAGPCCYEVSHEMAADFQAAGLPVHGRCLDLWESNVQQLTRAGLPLEHITVTGLCTICDTRFYSYRRGDSTARNLAMLML